MNIAFLIGHVGRDPQIRSFPDGDRCAQISLATSKYKRNPATGAGETATEWHRVRFYGPATGGLVDRVSRFVGKGSRIAVVGEISTSTIVGQQGERILITYIDVRRPDGLELLDRRKDAGETAAAPAGQPAASGTAPAPSGTPAAPAAPAASAPKHLPPMDDGFDDAMLSDAMLDGFEGADPPF